jgi:hypothetical protein
LDSLNEVPAHKKDPHLTRGILAGLLGLSTLPCLAQSPAPAPGEVVVSGSVRVRGEAWDWFEPNAGNANYAYAHSLVRLGISRQSPTGDWTLELEQPTLFNVPTDAVQPAPQGQLGLGAAYRAVNKSQTASLFLKQGFYRWKSPKSKSQVRVGRFEFVEGLETSPADPTLAALKRDRIAHRLLGNFGWSLVGRSYDGVQYTRALPEGNVNLVAVRPTQGVFQLDGMGDLDVNVLYAAYSRPLPSATRPGDARVFLIDYDDHRPLGKVDNRPAAVRDADKGDVHIQTLGGHYLRTLPVGSGVMDFTLWGAAQAGKWGAQKHRGSAAAIEAGYQPKKSRIKPWIRAGYFQSSGDGDPNNGTHSTFFSMLPTPRIYARFPFYNQMNNRDLFIEFRAKPHPKWNVRADAHVLQLSSPGDLWYGGGGAFQPDSFGFNGRPSGGRKGLARVYDLSLDYQPSPTWTATLYGAVAQGKGVIRSVYPQGSNGSFIYTEITRKW